MVPNAGTDKSVKCVAKELTLDTYVNIVPQQRPGNEAGKYADIARRIARAEFQQALRWAREAGLRRIGF